jgi:hypothetical protein
MTKRTFSKSFFSFFSTNFLRFPSCHQAYSTKFAAEMSSSGVGEMSSNDMKCPIFQKSSSHVSKHVKTYQKLSKRTLCVIFVIKMLSKIRRVDLTWQKNRHLWSHYLKTDIRYILRTVHLNKILNFTKFKQYITNLCIVNIKFLYATM